MSSRHHSEELASSANSLTHITSVLKEVRRRFSLFTDQNDQAAIPGDFLDLIFANAVRYGGLDEYEKVLAVYRKPPSPQHKAAAMRAFCCARDEKLLDRTIKFMHTDEVKMQDMMYFYGGLSGNRLSRRKVWADLQTNLDRLVVKFKGNFTLGRLVGYSISGFNTKKDLDEITTFFEGRDTKEYKQAYLQALDAVRAKTAWIERDGQDVASWLQKNGESPRDVQDCTERVLMRLSPGYAA